MCCDSPISHQLLIIWLKTAIYALAAMESDQYIVLVNGAINCGTYDTCNGSYKPHKQNSMSFSNRKDVIDLSGIKTGAVVFCWICVHCLLCYNYFTLTNLPDAVARVQ